MKDKQEAKTKDKEPWGVRDVLQMLLPAAILYLLLTFVVTPAKVVGDSMEPTMYDGTLMLVSRIHEPERGDIAVIDSSAKEQIIIKRIIAMPGDTLEIQNGITFLNGEPLEEPYVTNVVEGEYYPETTIPDGFCFVMGDNRGVSVDSRSYIGMIPLDEIIGTKITQLF